MNTATNPTATRLALRIVRASYQARRSALRSIDLGNNETASCGVTRSGDGWLALTFTASRTFKTERGAIAWLARRGFRADGSRAEAS